MKKTILFNHGGSANHGCEALVRTVCALLGDSERLTVYSEAPEQDVHYGIDKIASLQPAISTYSKLSAEFLSAYLHLKRTGDYFPMDCLPYLKSIRTMQPGDIEISVGGDIYCYEDFPKFIELHKRICARGCKSVLLGCSLEKELLQNPVFLEDMRNYDYISARESLTYSYLKQAGLTHVGMAPDTAFLLPEDRLPLPEGFLEGNTVGINVSPLISEREIKPGIVYHNFEYLISSILSNTDCAVALIPHVVWDSNDDRTVLKLLYERFKKTGRIVMIEDHNCMQLKGYISRCRFFVGARTHATIAAYSTCVPTLVLGYSVKSRGIAKDLFGTDDHYVIPVQDVREEDDLERAFLWIWKHEQEIQKALNNRLPEYLKGLETLKTDILCSI